MPLEKPQPRKHIHTRDIQCRGYQRDDGLWDIEGTIMDTKTYSFDNIDRDGIPAGEPLHHMRVRLTVDDDLVVVKAEASTEAGPYNICGDVTGVLQTLEGVAISPGWRKEVIKSMGGIKGCTHITDLVVGPMAVTAHQTITSARMRRKAVTPGTDRPEQIDTCHAYARGSSVVKRLWPEFHEES